VPDPVIRARRDLPEVPDPVSLRERLRAELTAAIRAQDPLRRDTLRMASAAAYAVEKREHRELSDDELTAVLAREVKTRQESIEAFRAGRRDDLVARESAEIEILRGFLPEPLDEAAIERLVEEAVAATGATSAREMGRVMGWLSPRTRGRADGRHVSELVARALARADLAAHDGGTHT
jgi:uncharacterized protein YqeY